VTTPLPVLRLGRTDMQVTRVGLGAWALGGPGWAAGWGPQDDRDSIAVIHRAVEQGLNWIDTAAVYGLGHSETLVRAALGTLPPERRPYVFTKCGLICNETNRSQIDPIASPASIRREVDGSLARLGVERIDLYQIHSPPKDGTLLEDYWQVLLDLKQAGKVRAVGLSNHCAAQLEAAERVGHVDTLQAPLSAIRRDSLANELSWCVSRDTAMIVYSPMQSGLLSGTFSAERAAALPRDDWRSRNGEFRGRRLARNLELADALRVVAELHGTSVAAVAIAWTLTWTGVTCAIAGARAPAQLDDWIDAARLVLNEHDLRAIATAIERTGAGSGPVWAAQPGAPLDALPCSATIPVRDFVARP
jgi:aryl-alcohol dehydrogenase-like predicted oxidoreductase